MRWEGQRESQNVEDRRSGGGRRAGGIGLGSLVVALFLGWALGINPLSILGVMEDVQQQATVQEEPAQDIPQNDKQARFVSTILASTEDAWTKIFTADGQTYTPPKLVLFRGVYPTACGMGQAAMGPFYCPADEKVYIDLSFYDTLEKQLGAPGEFARAYVIAHEVGHHVQKLLGVHDEADRLRRRMSEKEANALSVRVELQADCFAGVWGYMANKQTSMIEAGDVKSGLRAASQIGDDTLQRQSQGRVVPDSFTHGTSEQRVHWFKQGLESGDPAKCDTFSASHL